MADKRIEDFAQLAEANDDDLLLVSSESETYTIKVGTLKAAVTGAATAAAASAAAAEAAAEQAKKDAENAVTKSGEAVSKATSAEQAATKAAAAATASANSATAAQQAAVEAQQALQDATEAVDTINDFAEDIESLRTQLANKLDDAYVEGGYLFMSADGKVTVGPLGPFSGDGTGTGSSAGSTIRITNLMTSRSFSIMSGDPAKISYNWTSVDSEDGSSLGAGSATWTVNGTKVATVSVEQGDNSFDVTKYLTTGAANTVKLTIEDAYGNTKSFIWTVTVTSYSMTWDLDNMAYHGSLSLTVKLTPVGEGTKTVHLTCDGQEIYTAEVETSNRSKSVTIAAQSHGAHVIEAWFEATVEGETISTDKLRHVGIWVEIGNTTPVIAAYDSEVEIPQYSTGNITYLVYNPAAATTNIKLVEGYTTVSELEVDSTIQTWAYRATTSGSVSLSIRTADETAVAEIAVTVSDIGYDIQEVTEGLGLDVDPTGHNNSEVNRLEFGYTDGDGENHPFVYSANFDWVNGGFQQDDDGVTAFVIKRGTYVQADCGLFSDEVVSSGKSIKVVFKATNVRDYDAELLNCVSGNIGLALQAQQAVLSSELKSISIPYCEDRKIEMDVNIESAAENRLATVWLRGKPARSFQYSTSDNWTQATTQTLKIGSDECDVWLYRMKMYGNSLTRFEILDNFIADCGDAEEMVARYERNDFFNKDGSININTLATKSPKLRILKVGADKVTTGKDDEVICTVELIFTDGGAEYTFYATGVIMTAQGTSALGYGEAAFNLDLDFSNAVWTRGDGVEITEFAMTENSIPVNYFNIKLNVASSENANNVVLADDYNTFQPFLTAARRANPKVRDTIEGHPCAVFFTNTGTSATMAGSRTVQAGETILYGCGDMNNSKKNYAVFGQDNDTYPMQCCIEILNNIDDQCRFKSDDLSTETWGDDGHFKFRFPKNGTDAMKAAFQEMLSWVVSTDRDNPTGNALDAAVTIDGTTYTNDTAQYRLAKFKAELANYFSVGSLLYHYLFTERHCMIDNRAKNVFLSYEWDPDVNDGAGGYRWNVCKDYDNDTADGNDNEGGLTYTYGIEDTDAIGTKMAFNASDSTLWCNIRDGMNDELKTMYVSLETAGAWKSSRILTKYEDHQSPRPEALVAEDMWGKYFAPLINNANSAYVEMMQGDKNDQRTQFETYQERYIATKYYGNLALNEKVTFRGNTPNSWAGVEPNGNITLKLYHDGYALAKYGNHYIHIRLKRGVSYTIICPVTEALADTEIYLYLASNITEIDDVSGLYNQYIDIGPATRLRKLIAGSGEVGYENSNMTAIGVGNNKLMEYLDLRGAKALATDLNLRHMDSLTTLLLSNSAVTGVAFAENAPIVTADLPPVSSLIAQGLGDLESFKMDGSNLTTLWVEETPIIDTLALVKAATNLNRSRLPDVEWSTDNADVLTRLAGLSGVEWGEYNGEEVLVAADGPMLGGSCYIAAVSQEELTAIMATFLDLAVTYGTMVESYTVKFVDYDSTVLNTQTVRQFGAATNPVSAGYINTPTRESTVDTVYTFIGWDLAFNYILADTTVTAVYSETARTYTVRWWNGTTLLQTNTVEAYGSCAFEGGDLESSAGAIWMGWDKLANSVESDLDINAVFVSPTLPDTVATGYDYLYSDNPDDNSGYSLSEFYGIIASGQAKNYFAVGDRIKIVPVTTVFADTEIILEVYGFNHYKLADDSGEFASTVFGMVGVMNASRGVNSSNSNAGGWAQCTTRTYLNESVFNALPQQWKAMIKTVEVLSTIGGTSATVATSEDKLFLFSHAEVGFDASVVPYKYEVDEGAEQVTFGVFTDNASRIKKTYNGEGSAVHWWLRSPDPSSSTHYRTVNANGGAASSGTASGGNYLSFGFCI